MRSRNRSSFLRNTRRSHHPLAARSAFTREVYAHRGRANWCSGPEMFAGRHATAAPHGLSTQGKTDEKTFASQVSSLCPAKLRHRLPPVGWSFTKKTFPSWPPIFRGMLSLLCVLATALRALDTVPESVKTVASIAFAVT